MQHGGASVEPSWATSAYTYYGGLPARNDLFLTMSGFRGQVIASPLNVAFGDSLRLERRK